MTPRTMDRLRVCSDCPHYRLGTAFPSRCEEMPAGAAEFRSELEREDGLCPLSKWALLKSSGTRGPGASRGPGDAGDQAGNGKGDVPNQDHPRAEPAPPLGGGGE